MHRKDNTILDILKQGDESALRELFHQYYMPLCIYSFHITDSFEQSEDIVQEFFIAFWEKKLYNSITTNLRSYLFQSIRNASLTAVEKQNKYIFHDLEEEAYSPIDELYDEEELKLRLQTLLDELTNLPEQGYKVLVAIAIEKKKYKEVAEELGISVNTVKTHLSRALKYLRSKNLLLSLIFLF